MVRDPSRPPFKKEKNSKNNDLSKTDTSKLKQSQQHSGIESEGQDLLLDVPCERGLVIAHYGSKAKVESCDTKTLFLCHQRIHLGEVITGDYVSFQKMEETKGIIVEIEPRLNVLSRPKEKKKDQLIAANITQMIVVVAPTPQLPETFLSRYLVLAAALNFDLKILVNKCDLEGPALTTLLEFVQLYKALEIPILEVSSATGKGMSSLLEWLKDNVSIFVGQSGVGKSSLVNQLIPGSDIRVGGLSSKSKKGCHTTTGTALYHLNSGGDLIDSPGIRQLHLWDFSSAQIEDGFKEFEPYLGQCQFRNCRHHEEIGCALKAAVEAGHISAKRFEHYRILIDNGKLLK